MFFASRLVASSDQDKPATSAHDEEKPEQEYVEPSFPPPSISIF